MKKKSGAYFWQILPIVVILIAGTILVTWQITYNYVKKEMDSKYTKVLQDVTSANDISRTMYSVDSILRSSYIGEIDDEKLLDYTITGYVYGLGDKYASYMTADEFEDYIKENVDGKKVGIGVTCVFDYDAGGLYLLSVYDGTPASKASVVPGEVITKVDGVSVIEVGYNAALERIGQGNAGDTVNLSVKSEEGTERIVSIVLEEIDIETVSYRMINKDTGIIKISEFTGTTPKEFKKAIEKLTVLGAERFIFDVRNNPGGNLESIVETLDFVLPAGNIITIINKNGSQQTEISDSAEFSAPMVVLVNGNTASAAELFTAALRDYDKADIVGETTYGKGSVQEIIMLPNGGAASVSVSTYIPPCGVSYDGIGIVPDYEVSLPDDVFADYYRMTDEEDVQLQKAIEIVTQMETTVIQ